MNCRMNLDLLTSLTWPGNEARWFTSFTSCPDTIQMQYKSAKFADSLLNKHTSTVPIIIKVYVFAVYASHAHLNDLWTNTCRLVSRRGTCFWDCRSCMCNKVWKVWGGQSVRTTLKEFRGCECSLEPHRTRGYGRFSRRPHALFASQGAAALSRTHRYRSGLHSVVAAFALCLLFSFHALALPHSHDNFCHFVIATMRLLAPLQHWIRWTYVSVHNFLYTGFFNCIPKWDGCLHASHTFNCIP